jgi:hypothetical protein
MKQLISNKECRMMKGADSRTSDFDIRHSLLDIRYSPARNNETRLRIASGLRHHSR